MRFLSPSQMLFVISFYLNFYRFTSKDFFIIHWARSTESFVIAFNFSAQPICINFVQKLLKTSRYETLRIRLQWMNELQENIELFSTTSSTRETFIKYFPNLNWQLRVTFCLQSFHQFNMSSYGREVWSVTERRTKQLMEKRKISQNFC